MADPVRLRLLALVSTNPIGEVCACVLSDAVDRSQSTVSHHMGRLVQAGLVTRTQRGKWAWYRVEADALDELRDVLGHDLRHPARRPLLLLVDGDEGQRSRIAAGLVRDLAGDAMQVVASGAAPSAAVAPAVDEVMAEDGIDVSDLTPVRWTSELARTADLVACLACDEPEGVPPGTRVVRWGLEEPDVLGHDAARRVRDEVRGRVDALVAQVVPGCCDARGHA